MSKPTKQEELANGIAIKSVRGDIIFQSTKTTIKEAIAEKGDGYLSNADLSGYDLRGAHLFGANLSGSDLRGSDLRGSKLFNADLRGANLFGANLCDADLSNANLFNADLSGADLHRAKFYGRGGTQRLKRSQIPEFLAALGFVIE
jgi:uncharacterized protein YjbI with pentapeptide repeats